MFNDLCRCSVSCRSWRSCQNGPDAYIERRRCRNKFRFGNYHACLSDMVFIKTCYAVRITIKLFNKLSSSLSMQVPPPFPQSKEQTNTPYANNIGSSAGVKLLTYCRGKGKGALSVKRQVDMKKTKAGLKVVGWSSSLKAMARCLRQCLSAATLF